MFVCHMLRNYQQKFGKKNFLSTRSFTLSQNDFKIPNFNSRNYYDILGVEQTATDRDIRKAFLKLSKQYHPDSNTTDASLHGKFVKINEAFTVLGKSSTRTDYDRKLNPETIRSRSSYPTSTPFDWKRTNFKQKQSFRTDDFDKNFFDLLRRQMEQDRQRAKNFTNNNRQTSYGMINSYFALISIISFLIGFGVLIHALQWRIASYSDPRFSTDPRSRSYHAYQEWHNAQAMSMRERRKDEEEK